MADGVQRMRAAVGEVNGVPFRVPAKDEEFNFNSTVSKGAAEDIII